MSQTLSSSLARCYGLARVARVWKISRASVYRSRKETFLSLPAPSPKSITPVLARRCSFLRAEALRRWP